MEAESKNSEDKSLSKTVGNHWSEGLLRDIANPKLIIYESKFAIIIKDLYPKALYHYLVCAKEDIPDIRSIKFEHLSLLKHMHRMAVKLTMCNEGRKFLIGYHSLPSMLRLHLHVISDDFDSVHLKTKRHWNNFNSSLFLKSENVIDELEAKGKLTFKSVSEVQALMDQPLKCHKCHYKFARMVDLKYHLKTHESTRFKQF